MGVSFKTSTSRKSVFYQVVNESRSGETTASAVTRIPKLLKTYSPEIVIIQLGVNDAMRKVSLPLVRNNLRNIIRDSLFAHSKVLVLRTCLPTDSEEDYRRQFAKIYEQVTNETNTELTPCFVKGLNWKTTEDFNEIYTSKSVQFILLDNVWVDLFPLLSK